MLDIPQEQSTCSVRFFIAAPGICFFSDVKQMCDGRDMVMADVMRPPPTSYIHVNMGCLSRSWLDHIVLLPRLYNIMD